MLESSQDPTLTTHRDRLSGRTDSTDLRVEALPGLEWSLAAETEPPSTEAHSPESLRTRWVHRVPEEHVLDLFRKLSATGQHLPAPWWLPALDRGELSSRAEAFAIEDEVHMILRSRAGWVFVPWVGPNETGYWEYDPPGRPIARFPTTVMLTDQHPGWISVVPAHPDNPPPPVPLKGPSGLTAALNDIESW